MALGLSLCDASRTQHTTTILCPADLPCQGPDCAGKADPQARPAGGAFKLGAQCNNSCGVRPLQLLHMLLAFVKTACMSVLCFCRTLRLASCSQTTCSW